MALVAGIDFGGGAVKACVADVASGDVLAVSQHPTEVQRPTPGRAEFDPGTWWRAATAAVREAVAGAGLPASDYRAVTVTSLRQGYVLLDATSDLAPGVVNADRRGASRMETIHEAVGRERLYEVTGHWSAPQLTLPKLLEEQHASPERWARTESVLFVHDWAIWRLCGERLSEPSLASAGQLLDVRKRSWATELLEAVGLDPAVLPRLVDAGTVAGELRDPDLGLPLGTPVVVGGADTQMAAAGAGGLEDGAASVVAGTTTPIQVSTAVAPRDPERHPWVSAHLVPERWAVETNAGYAGLNLDWLAALTGQRVDDLAEEAFARPAGASGMTALVSAPLWSEDTWSRGAPNALVGFEPAHPRADVARAFLEAHAYAVRSNLEDLERAMGGATSRVCLVGGAARSLGFTRLVADVTGRAIGRMRRGYPTGRAFAWLAARALGLEGAEPHFDGEMVEPSADDRLEDGFRRYLAASDSLQRELAGWAM